MVTIIININLKEIKITRSNKEIIQKLYRLIKFKLINLINKLINNLLMKLLFLQISLFSSILYLVQIIYFINLFIEEYYVMTQYYNIDIALANLLSFNDQQDSQYWHIAIQLHDKNNYVMIFEGN